MNTRAQKGRGLLSVILGGWVAAAAAGNLTAPWTAYLGAAAGGRATQTEGAPAWDWLEAIQTRGPDLAPWAGTYRGVNREQNRLADFLAYEAEGRLGARFEPLKRALWSVTGTRDAVLQLGGLPFDDNPAGIQEYLALVQADAGARWRRLLAGWVKEWEAVAAREGSLIWQLGNEVNNRGLSTGLQRLDPTLASGQPDDPAVVPFYVETYLAPAVAAIRTAAQERYGRTAAIRVALGSVAAMYRPAAQDWLRTLAS